MKKYFLLGALLWYVCLFHKLAYAEVFRIASYNTKLCPECPCSYYNKELCDPYKRAALIPLNFKDYDVVSFQELLSNTAEETVLTLMSRYGFHYTDKTNNTLWSRLKNGYIFSGGVRLFSRHPIIETDYMIFPRSYFFCFECLIGKGVVYAKIQHISTGQMMHFFTFHAQASRENIANKALESTLRKKRTAQIQALKDFIDSKHIPATETIFVFGDFNIHKGDAMTPRELRSRVVTSRVYSIEFKRLLKTLHAVLPGTDKPHSLPYSHDTQNNAMTRLTSDDPIQVDLDHILCIYKTNTNVSHPCTFQQAVRDTFALKVNDSEDLSDHHPVTFTFQIN